jgi:hypothetical protein
MVGLFRSEFRNLCCAALGLMLIPVFGCAPGRTEGGIHGLESANSMAPHEAPHGKLLICLFDETASYAGQPGLWEDSLQKAATATRELRAGDSFMALAITDRGWRSQDIIFPYTTLTSTSLLVMREKAELMNRIRQLKVRPTSSGFLVNGKPIGKPRGTDILGAIDYAAFLAQSAGKRAVSFVLFTDLEDEAPKNVRTAGRRLQTFPLYSHVIALNVRANNADSTQERIQRWCLVLNGMKNPDGDDVTSPSDFVTIGQAAEVKSFFGWERR